MAAVHAAAVLFKASHNCFENDVLLLLFLLLVTLLLLLPG
jgi:hypothetical protein